MKHKFMRLLGIGMALCLLSAACGKEADGESSGLTELEPVAIGDGSGAEAEDSGADSGSAEGSLESGAAGQKAFGTGSSEQEPAGESGSGAAESKPAESGNGEAASNLVVSCETVRDGRQDEAGEEIIFAEYPRFYVEDQGHEALSAALDEINEYWKAQSATFLDETEGDAKEYRASVDAESVFGQGIRAEVARCDGQVVCLTVLRTVQMGGPHPNNYFDAYNLNAATGEKLLLADVMTVDEGLVDTILKQLHENYPEVEFDDEAVAKEISERLANGAVDWYFAGDQISLGFPEGAFGYPHAVGSLGVMLPAE